MSDLRMYKRSQRPTWSCTQCSRRKIKCSKDVPCQQCIKRNAAHLCSLDHESVVTESRPTFSSQNSGQVGLSPSTRDATAAGPEVLKLVQQMSSTIADLDRRLYSLEGGDQRHRRYSHYSPNQSSPGFSSYDASMSNYHASANGNHYSPASASSSRPPLQQSPSTRRYTHQHSASGSASEGVADSALTFEYLALGRDRHRGILQQQQQQEASTGARVPRSTTDNILYDAMAQPLPTDIQLALLPPKALDYVLTFAKDVIAWQHACIHTPTFQRECEAFFALQAHERWLWTDPLWLALFFIIQSIAVHQMPPGDVEHLIGSAERPISQILLDAAIRCLEVGRYLSEPSLFTCQALTILCVTGHNVADSNLLSSYLAIGIKTAQMLNLHNLAGESKRVAERVRVEGGEAGVLVDASPSWRSRIVRLEVGKRIWWSLVQQDYLALPFCGTSMVNPRHHDTPLPDNVHDDDLDRGQLRSTYDEGDLTLVQKARLTSKMAQIVYSFFEQLPYRGRSAHARLEENVQPFEQQLLELLPSTQPRSSNPTLKFGLALRRYINIGVSHKVLVLHRAFCSLNPTPPQAQIQLSQARCLDAARQILEQVRGIKPSGRPEGQVGTMWTVSYQAVAAAMVIALTHFQTSHTFSVNVARSEVFDARDVLHTLSARSTIARRGVEMLAELVQTHDAGVQQSSVQARRTFGSDAAADAVSDHASPAKRARINGGDEQTPASTTATASGVAGLEFDFDWDVAGVLHSMPDVSKLFDGSIGNPFVSF